MKYLVIKDCPGFKVGDVVETIQIYSTYYPKDTHKYFKPMWFNFGDKIKMKKWRMDEYFIPTQIRKHLNLGYVFYGYYFNRVSKNFYTYFFECLNQDYWEIYNGSGGSLDSKEREQSWI